MEFNLKEHPHILDYYPYGVKDVDNCELQQFVRKEQRELREAGIYSGDEAYPQEVKMLSAEFATVHMLDVCFAYHGITNGKINNFDRSYHQLLNDYKKAGGTNADLDKLIDVHAAYLSTCKVLHNVHTDFEGVPYNSILYAEPSTLAIELSDAQLQGLVLNKAILSTLKERRDAIFESIPSDSRTQMQNWFCHYVSVNQALKATNALTKPSEALLRSRKDCLYSLITGKNLPKIFYPVTDTEEIFLDGLSHHKDEVTIGYEKTVDKKLVNNAFETVKWQFRTFSADEFLKMTVDRLRDFINDCRTQMMRDDIRTALEKSVEPGIEICEEDVDTAMQYAKKGWSTESAVTEIVKTIEETLEEEPDR